MQRRPAGVSDMVDAAENYLDKMVGATASRRELAGRVGGRRVGTAWARRERVRFFPGGLLVGQRVSSTSPREDTQAPSADPRRPSDGAAQSQVRSSPPPRFP